MNSMRCLAVRQPWAWALVTGAKDVENRSWTTDYRGPVIIQASAGKTLVNHFAKSDPTLPKVPFAFGALIGVAELVNVVPLSQDLETNPWAWGPYCWRFTNARMFVEPIPAKGKLNLYTLPQDVAARVQSQIDSAFTHRRAPEENAWIDAITRQDSPEERVVTLYDNYVQLEDQGSAFRLGDQLIAAKGTAEGYILRANARLLGPHPDPMTALVDVNQAIGMDPDDARGYLVRSRAYETLATIDRDKAVELDPGLGEEEDEDGAEEEA